MTFHVLCFSWFCVILCCNFILTTGYCTDTTLQTEEHTRKHRSVTGFKIPRFVVLKAREVNMRSGPGINHHNKITYKCMFAPVEITAEFDTWRLVKDVYGNNGWIHEAMLDGKRYVQIFDTSQDTIQNEQKEILMFRLPSDRSRPIARLKIGVIGKLIKCNEEWCKIAVGRTHSGWVWKQKLWGVYSHEIF